MEHTNLLTPELLNKVDRLPPNQSFCMRIHLGPDPDEHDQATLAGRGGIGISEGVHMLLCSRVGRVASGGVDELVVPVKVAVGFADLDVADEDVWVSAAAYI